MLLAGALAQLRADGPYESVTASATWQDNVTNSAANDGIKGDLGLDTRSDLTWIRSLDFSTLLTFTLSSDLSLSTNYSGLDNLGVGPAIEFRRKLGVGPFAPALYARLEGLAVGFQDPERSNISGALAFGYQQRLTDTLLVGVDARVGSYDARDIVFTGDYASVASRLCWDMSEVWRLKLSAGWRTGDGVSNFTAYKGPYGWAPVDEGADNLPGAWHYVSTFRQPYVAYLVSARTWSYGFGISPAVGRHTALSLDFAHTDSQAGLSYIDNIISLSVVHQF
ncbi:MAG TPA: hypothetical protein VIJ19_01505 [Opitutaceae bacterium]